MTPVEVPIISVKGRYLWCCSTTTERFIVKGVVYQHSRRSNKDAQQQTLDPLADENLNDVQRDVAIFKDLGLNAIWVYTIDPNLQHDKSMSLLAAAGIYVIAATSDHRNGLLINRTCPRQSYNDSVQEYFQSIAACMARYTNTLGLCISTDLIDEYSERMGLVTETYETLAIATSNLKRYMNSEHAMTGQRILPICVADTYWSLTNTNTFGHLTQREVAGRDPDGRVDFYCVNHYGTVSENSTSGHHRDNNRVAWNMIHTLPQFRDYTSIDDANEANDQVPIVLSEYSGDNSQRPRLFNETVDLYSEAPPLPPAPPAAPAREASIPMQDVISGGFVYEYFEHANGYGLVKVDSRCQITKLADYEYLSKALSS